jgi:hypothetical protein
LNCPFSQSCWALLNLHIQSGDPFVALVALKDQLHVPFFMDIIIILSWCI